MNQTSVFGNTLLFVVWVGALFLFLGCGIYADDYIYIHEFIATSPDNISFCHGHGEEIHTIAQAARSSWLHYFYWGNGRLGSTIMFFMTLLPVWVWGVCNATFLTGMFWCWLKAINRGWSRRPLMAMSVAFLLWIALPWRENMFATTYCINYVWCAFLNLWLLCLIEQRLTDIHRRRMSRLTFVGYLILALCASMMHEGLSVTMDAWLFMVWLHLLCRLRRAPRHRREIIKGNVVKLSAVALVYAIGSFIVIFAPSTLSRGATIQGWIYFLHFRDLVYMLFIQLWPITLVGLTLLWVRLRHGKKGLRRVWRKNGALVIAGLAGALTMYYAGSGCLRSHWMNILLMLIVEWRILWPVHLPGSIRLKKIAAWTLLLLYAVWLGAVCVLQWDYKAQKEAVEKAMEQQQSNIVYADLDAYDANPWWSLDVPRMPYLTLWSMFMHYMPRNPDRTPKYGDIALEAAALPTDLSTVNPDSLPLVPGTAGLRGVYPILYSKTRLNQLLVCTFSKSEARVWHRHPGHKLFPYGLLTDERTVPVFFYLVRTTGSEVPAYKGEPTDSLFFYKASEIPRTVYGLTLQRVDLP